MSNLRVETSILQQLGYRPLDFTQPGPLDNDMTEEQQREIWNRLSDIEVSAAQIVGRITHLESAAARTEEVQRLLAPIHENQLRHQLSLDNLNTQVAELVKSLRDRIESENRDRNWVNVLQRIGLVLTYVITGYTFWNIVHASLSK